jgi:hypothetical protein
LTSSTIVAIVLGVLISAACIGIPQWVRVRRQHLDDDDTRAYLKETGRSVKDIEQGNAAIERQEQDEVQARDANRD